MNSPVDSHSGSVRAASAASRVDDGLRQAWRRRTAQEAAVVHLVRSHHHSSEEQCCIGGVLIQFAEPPFADIQFQHYAFRVSGGLFDAAYARLEDKGVEHWADPRMTEPGKINTGHGGRGVYFRDPTGHFFEMLTHSYLTPQGEPVP